MKRISSKAKQQARVYSMEIDRQTNGLTHEEIAEAIEQYVEAAWLAGYRAAMRSDKTTRTLLKPLKPNVDTSPICATA